MELTELEKKHALTEQFLNELFFYPIEYKYSKIKEQSEAAVECFRNSESEEEMQILKQKIQWLHNALLVIEKAIPQNCHNRRYEPLEIPNIAPAQTEKKFTSAEEIKEMLLRRLESIGKYFEGKANK